MIECKNWLHSTHEADHSPPRSGELDEAKRRAKQRGVAMNTVLVEALEKGLGIDGQKRGDGFILS